MYPRRWEKEENDADEPSEREKLEWLLDDLNSVSGALALCGHRMFMIDIENENANIPEAESKKLSTQIDAVNDSISKISDGLMQKLEAMPDGGK